MVEIRRDQRHVVGAENPRVPAAAADMAALTLSTEAVLPGTNLKSITDTLGVEPNDVPSSLPSSSGNTSPTARCARGCGDHGTLAARARCRSPCKVSTVRWSPVKE